MPDHRACDPSPGAANSAFPPLQHANGGKEMAMGRDVHPPDEVHRCRRFFPPRAIEGRARRAATAVKGEGTMHRMAVRAACLATGVLISVWCAASPWAGTTGKLTGKVTNEKNEPLAGVNLRIEGQRLGALSDDQGNFVIIGIPAGNQMVRANLLGYAAFVAEKVGIQPDFTTEPNFTKKTE